MITVYLHVRSIGYLLETSKTVFDCIHPFFLRRARLWHIVGAWPYKIHTAPLHALYFHSDTRPSEYYPSTLQTIKEHPKGEKLMSQTVERFDGKKSVVEYKNVDYNSITYATAYQAGDPAIKVTAKVIFGINLEKSHIGTIPPAESEVRLALPRAESAVCAVKSIALQTDSTECNCINFLKKFTSLTTVIVNISILKKNFQVPDQVRKLFLYARHVEGSFEIKLPKSLEGLHLRADGNNVLLPKLLPPGLVTLSIKGGRCLQAVLPVGLRFLRYIGFNMDVDLPPGLLFLSLPEITLRTNKNLPLSLRCLEAKYVSCDIRGLKSLIGLVMTGYTPSGEPCDLMLPDSLLYLISKGNALLPKVPPNIRFIRVNDANSLFRNNAVLPPSLRELHTCYSSYINFSSLLKCEGLRVVSLGVAFSGLLDRLPNSVEKVYIGNKQYDNPISVTPALKEIHLAGYAGSILEVPPTVLRFALLHPKYNPFPDKTKPRKPDPPKVIIAPSLEMLWVASHEMLSSVSLAKSHLRVLVVTSGLLSTTYIPPTIKRIAVGDFTEKCLDRVPVGSGACLTGIYRSSVPPSNNCKWVRTLAMYLPHRKNDIIETFGIEKSVVPKSFISKLSKAEPYFNCRSKDEESLHLQGSYFSSPK